MQQPLTAGLAILALFLLFCLGMAIAPGCQAARQLDQRLWGLPPETGDTNSPADPALPIGAPPIVEIAASLLALGGFGGMARWISKSKAASNGRCDRLQKDVDRLQQLLDEHSGHSHPDIG